MNDALKIRKAVMGDVQVVAAYNREMARETEGLDLDYQEVVRGVKAVIKDGHKGFYLVALQGPDILGQLLITPEWSDWRNRFFWWIQSVYVHPDHRNRNIFKRLFHHLTELASARRDIAGLRLYVEVNNRQAKSVYETLGMFRCGYDMYEYLF